MSTTDPASTPTLTVPVPSLRRDSADPVILLMHRHQQLCESAVDPLEIAAGLEAHGITDRTAARFRHRDVFSLAEELYARVPRDRDRPAVDLRPPTPAPTPHPPAPVATAVTAAGDGARTEARTEARTQPGTWWPAPARRFTLSLLPGAVSALTLMGLHRTSGQTHLAIALAGAFALSGALSSVLRRAPLRAEGRRVPAAGLWVYWLLAYLVCGDGLLDALVAGGPHGPWPASLTPLVGLSFAIVPAVCCAHLFSVRARRRLSDSRGLADFAAGARPLLLATVALYVCALTGLVLLTALAFGDSAALAPTVALGTLLLLARLLTVHGFPDSAAAGLVGACLAEALACLSVLAGRIPGGDLIAAPVTGVVQTWGAGAVPTLACAAAALGLLAHAVVTLGRASAHT